ncbi:MAG: ATP-binding protein [Nitriliruptoraceae bacterium]
MSRPTTPEGLATSPSETDPRRLTIALMSAPAVRVAVLAPSVVTIVYVLLRGTIANPWLFMLIGALGLLLGVVAVLRPFDRVPGVEDLEVAWMVLSGVIGPPLAAVMLVGAVDVEVLLFAPLFALILVAVSAVPPERYRVGLGTWALLCWLGTLIAVGEREPTLLFLHLGGGGALLSISRRTAQALSASLAQAADARSAAERRADLLATLLRTHDLDTGVVLRGVAEGLLGLGFDVATIREVDRDAGVARLAEGAARGDVTIERDLPLDDPTMAAVLAAERPHALERGRHDVGGLVRSGQHSALLFPIFADGEVTAIVAASTAGHAPSLHASGSAGLLIAQAGEALGRARAYREDEEALAELRRIDQRTQDFLSTVSHELRTPLTVVQGLAATLAERWDDLDPARRNDLLERVDTNAERLGAMVRRLLDSSMVGSGVLALEPERLLVAPVATASVDRLADVLQGHVVEVEVDPGLQVEADPALFEHVVENLLVNVARHTPSGTRAWVRGYQDGDRVVIEVVDEGPGIAESDLPHVLDRFYRGGDESHRVSTGGLGLGLAFVTDVVRAHGGDLRVAANTPSGTRFSFDVPRAPSD